MSSLKEFLCLKYLSRRRLLLTSYISCLSKAVGLTLMCLYGGGLKSKRTVKFVFSCGILKFPETLKPQTIKIKICQKIWYSILHFSILYPNWLPSWWTARITQKKKWFKISYELKLIDHVNLNKEVFVKLLLCS